MALLKNQCPVSGLTNDTLILETNHFQNIIRLVGLCEGYGCIAIFNGQAKGQANVIRVIIRVFERKIYLLNGFKLIQQFVTWVSCMTDYYCYYLI